MKGIIIENVSNLYRVKVDDGSVYEASCRGKFKKGEISPVVGDNVDALVIDEDNKKAVIEDIFDRKVYLKRPKVANITQIVLVVSSKDPKPDLLMLDKQLVFAEFLGLKAIIVLNKTDLDKKKEFEYIKNLYTSIGYTVIETEAKNKIGIQLLENELKNNINAFSGNSGVGKSTLINALFNIDKTKEGEVSKKNKRGKNTTTAIKLYELDDNTFIADTPGFSTFDISEVKSEELGFYFKEIKNEIGNCRYVGCSHVKEDECGVKEAVNKGIISKDRYDRFCKIYSELKEKEDYKKW